MKKNNVDCVFCKKDAPHSPLPELEIHSVKVFFCYNCRAEYVYWEDGSIASQSLYIEINNKMYRWTTGGGTCQLWYVKIPGEPGIRANQEMHTIKTFRFDNCPNITPQNIEQKVRTLLLMS